MDPGTAILLSSLIGTGAYGLGSWFGAEKQKKAGKLSAKEMKRKTMADLMNTALQNQAELQGQGLDSSRRLGQARTRGLLDAASTVRESFR